MSGANGGAAPQPGESADAPDIPEAGPARALTLHLLRMFETRMDAAGIAIDSQLQSFTSRLQLKLLAGSLLFLAVWGGIVLIAIALPEAYRIPVLAAVVVAFALGGVFALVAAQRKTESEEIGSMSWFLGGLKRDLEVLSRSLAQRPPHAAPAENRSSPNDLAA